MKVHMVFCLINSSNVCMLDQIIRNILLQDEKKLNATAKNFMKLACQSNDDKEELYVALDVDRGGDLMCSILMNFVLVLDLLKSFY